MTLGVPFSSNNAKRCFLTLLLSVCLSTDVVADSSSRILATGGAMSAEGAAGGGIVPWAMLAGYADEGEWGGTAWLSKVKPRNFTLDALGAAMTVNNRFELSISKQTFDIDVVSPGSVLELDIIGAKTRLFGDLLYTHVPQISLGFMYKQNSTYAIPETVGSGNDSGVDVYLAASKLWLNGPFHRSVFLNGTLRATKANQLGLVGFGGDKNDRHEIVAELSAGLFINRHWVLGAEYRQKPDNLSALKEDDWKDVFLGWFPNKRVAVVLAWTDLGSIAGFDNQDGIYLSVQLSR